MRQGTVSGRVKALREKAGISARELARVAGLAPVHVTNIERAGDGGITTQVRTMIALAIVLGVELDFLLRGKGTPPKTADVRESVARAWVARANARASSTGAAGDDGAAA